MPDLIDTHAHLDMPEFGRDLAAVLDRARAAGVRRIITVGADLPSSRRAVALTAEHADLSATVGVHPHDARTLSDAVLEELARLADHGHVVAVGEIGLDYHYDNSPRPAQRDAFAAQLRLAKRLDLPVVVHCREAHGDALAILREHAGAGLRGVVHCFSGSPADAEALLELGLHISFTGIVTFPKAAGAREVVKVVPLERTMVETDCPYLAPQPRRGKRNEPAYVVHVAEQIAALKGLDIDEVARVTTAVAHDLFGI